MGLKTEPVEDITLAKHLAQCGHGRSVYQMVATILQTNLVALKVKVSQCVRPLLFTGHWSELWVGTSRMTYLDYTHQKSLLPV